MTPTTQPQSPEATWEDDKLEHAFLWRFIAGFWQQIDNVALCGYVDPEPLSQAPAGRCSGPKQRLPHLRCTGEVGMSTERILGPAIRYKGVVYSLPEPKRHHHVLHEHAVIRNGVITSSIAGGEQGFYTDQRDFIDRREGKRVAIRSGQNMQHTGPPDTLFTEDMW